MNLIICMLLMISFMRPTRLSVQTIKERRSPMRRADTLAAGQHRNHHTKSTLQPSKSTSQLHKVLHSQKKLGLNMRQEADHVFVHPT
jgi:hypothetical protein